MINHKKHFRLNGEERLAARRCGGRNRAIGTEGANADAAVTKRGWLLNVFDQFANGHRFRTDR